MAEPKKRVQKKTAEKKWKGKDWYSISVPDWLGGAEIASTPSTDAKTVSNRVVEASIPDIMGDQGKYYMRMALKTLTPGENRNVGTKFHKFFCLDEYVARMARKGLGKVAVYVDVLTKDNWKIQVSVITILNRRANAEIRTKVNGIVNEIISEKGKDMTHCDFIKASIAGVFQMKIKKTASKVYPVRFCEIIKIETLKSA